MEGKRSSGDGTMDTRVKEKACTRLVVEIGGKEETSLLEW